MYLIIFIIFLFKLLFTKMQQFSFNHYRNVIKNNKKHYTSKTTFRNNTSIFNVLGFMRITGINWIAQSSMLKKGVATKYKRTITFYYDRLMKF